MYNNFIEEVMKEETTIDRIDEYVSYWHNNNVDKPLNEFLGLNEKEYEMWLKEGDEVIRGVIFHRKNDAQTGV